MSNASARLDLRLDPAIKELATRAADLSGSQSLSAFVTQAIRERATRVIEEAELIRLTNRSFDAFVAACEAPPGASDALQAARRRRNEKVSNGELHYRGPEQETT